MPFLPYFLCEVSDCLRYKQPIVLPFPNPPGKFPDPISWPTDDWRAYIACPSCGHVSVRTKKSPVVWEQFDQADLGKHHDDTNWYGTAFKCVDPTCRVSMQLYVGMPANSTVADAQRLLNSGKIRCRMECGHQFVGLPDGTQPFPVNGVIPTYDPKRR